MAGGETRITPGARIARASALAGGFDGLNRISTHRFSEGVDLMTRHFVAGVSLVGMTIAATAAVWTTYAERTDAHCQVPCGIYDDAARIARLREDATTITKAITQINELSGKHEAQSINQTIRWVNTKETHASHIIEVVSQYFLTQKVKPVAPGAMERNEYLSRLADHHAVMVAAMKTKQQVDPAAAAALVHSIDALAVHYK